MRSWWKTGTSLAALTSTASPKMQLWLEDRAASWPTAAVSALNSAQDASGTALLALTTDPRTAGRHRPLAAAPAPSPGPPRRAHCCLWLALGPDCSFLPGHLLPCYASGICMQCRHSSGASIQQPACHNTQFNILAKHAVLEWLSV